LQKLLIGACTDTHRCAAGHLWVTSLDCLLLRIAGPLSNAPGTLLQTLQLQQLLPSPADRFLPFDVLAMPLQPAEAADAAAVSRMRASWSPLGMGAVAGCSSAGQQLQQQGMACSSTQLVVTLHRGAREPGAVAVLRFGSSHQQQDAEEGSNRGVKGSAAADEQQNVNVVLVALLAGHAALKEPNMIAVL
jgi:hypothetical protein